MLSLQDNPEATAQEIWVHAALNYKTQRERERERACSFGLLPQGYCVGKTLKSLKDDI